MPFASLGGVPQLPAAWGTGPLAASQRKLARRTGWSPGDPDLMVHCVDLGARASAWPARLRAWLAWLVTAREPSLILLDMVPRSLGGPKPVTNPVTTTADRASRSEPVLESNPHLTWAGSTKADHARRTRQAWHARGQGFESP